MTKAEVFVPNQVNDIFFSRNNASNRKKDLENFLNFSLSIE